MKGSTRQTLRAGYQILTEHPALITWYVKNRVRNLAIPFERAFADGMSLAPRFVTLKPTLRCNLRCEFCRFVANGDVFGKRDWMEIEDWRRIIDEIAPYNPYICITGGEPTMYPQIAELIAHIKSHGLTCVMTTNGTLLQHRAEDIIKSPPDIIVLSIDGPREVHDSVRMVDGTFDKAMKGIQKLHELKQKHCKETPRLIINSAITGRTFEGAVQMIEVAKSFGAWAMNFQHFWFLTRQMVDTHNTRYGDCFPLDFEHLGGTETAGVDPGRLFETIERIKQEDFGLPIVFYPDLDETTIPKYYGEPEKFTHWFTPTCAWTATDIMPNGNVEPCFDLVAGNVLEDKFMNIWNNHLFREHRRRLTEDGPYPVCARCCAYFRRD